MSSFFTPTSECFHLIRSSQSISIRFRIFNMFIRARLGSGLISGQVGLGGVGPLKKYLASGRVGSGSSILESGRVGSQKTDPRSNFT